MTTRTPQLSLITVKSRYRGAILGTAIGDALGAPFECMSATDIQNQFPVISTFIDPKTVSRPSNVYQNIMKAGQWTDDTQLMRPIMWSIINLGYINPMDIATFNRKVYENETLRGWGKSTKEAVKRFSEGVSWTRAAEASIGIGNGVAMKAAPLGCYLSSMLDRKSFYSAINSIISVGKLTHTEMGITAGVLQSVLIAMSINGIRNKKLIMETLSSVEEDFFGDTRFTDKLKEAIKLGSIEKIAVNSGTSGKAIDSWVSAAAVFLNTKKRREAMPNLIKLIQQGGDTDTIGAMYGALIGARWGTAVFPKHLRKDVEQGRKLFNMAGGLFNSIEGDLSIFDNAVFDEKSITRILVA
jgi:ADP-ribosylglycohydrolase